MGRKIRMVPANWEHPKSERPNGQIDYQPMHDESWEKAIDDWIAGYLLWKSGEHESFNPKVRFKDYAGDPPKEDYYRPSWKPEEMTWFQVYETVSEGTPVTPPFATKEELVDYLVANGDFWDQKRRKEKHGLWTRERAQAFVGIGSVPSGVFTPEKGFQTGIQALVNEDAS